ncbi:unnamed protein product [Diabrotica balteata]|uniref:Uncharacterized protein n=1 Tax=Diabrotica balteata TaxID=107213 RepID=A0A9N9SYQ3_DIABA|nr:unnamed protein product [Diabrotica balteata]
MYRGKFMVDLCTKKNDLDDCSRYSAETTNVLCNEQPVSNRNQTLETLQISGNQSKHDVYENELTKKYEGIIVSSNNMITEFSNLNKDNAHGFEENVTLPNAREVQIDEVGYIPNPDIGDADIILIQINQGNDREGVTVVHTNSWAEKEGIVIQTIENITTEAVTIQNNTDALEGASIVQENQNTQTKDPNFNDVEEVSPDDRREDLDDDNGTVVLTKRCRSSSGPNLETWKKIKAMRQREKDQCDICVMYENGNLEEEIWAQHRNRKQQAREAMQSDIEKAKNNSRYVVITMDLQGVLLSPRLQASALYYKTKLIVHNFTMYNNANYDTTCYIWHEGEGAITSNEFSSCIVDFIPK